jgi:hypothetical protein
MSRRPATIEEQYLFGVSSFEVPGGCDVIEASGFPCGYPGVEQNADGEWFCDEHTSENKDADD